MTHLHPSSLSLQSCSARRSMITSRGSTISVPVLTLASPVSSPSINPTTSPTLTLVGCWRTTIEWLHSSSSLAILILFQHHPSQLDSNPTRMLPGCLVGTCSSLGSPLHSPAPSPSPATLRTISSTPQHSCHRPIKPMPSSSTRFRSPSSPDQIVPGAILRSPIQTRTLTLLIPRAPNDRRVQRFIESTPQPSPLDLALPSLPSPSLTVSDPRPLVIT